MNKDYIVEDIRNIRKQIESDCKKQGKSYFEYINELQKKSDLPIISKKPKRYKISKVS